MYLSTFWGAVQRIVDIEFNDITIDSNIYHDKLRVFIKDGSLRWKRVSTFPKHFHNGSQNKAQESYINDDPASGIREFMNFIRMMLE